MFKYTLFLALQFSFILKAFSNGDWPTDQHKKNLVEFLVSGKYLEVATSDSVVFHWETIGGRQNRCNSVTGNLDEMPVAEKCDRKAAQRPLSVKEVVEFSRYKADRFLNCNGQRGLYYATDPWVSKMYGMILKGSDDPVTNCWRLIATDIKKGTRFLRVTNDSKEIAKLGRAIDSETCARKLFEAMDHSRVATPDEVKCNDFKKQLFKDLHISGIRYEWEYTGTVAKLCGTDRQDRHAIIITNPDLVNGSRVYTKYGKESSSPSRTTLEERKAIQDIYIGAYYAHKKDEIIEPLWWDDEVKEGLPKTSKGFIPSGGKILNSTSTWMNQNLMNCQSTPPFQ